MSDISVIDNKPWKCSEANNGYLKSKTGKEHLIFPYIIANNFRNVPGAEESLLDSSAVSTVVQVAGSGTKTMVVPRTKPAKEKCLFATVLALIIFCGVLVFIIVGSKAPHCFGEFPSIYGSIKFSAVTCHVSKVTLVLLIVQ